LGHFVRGLTLSVSGFLGMSLCLNYSSSPDSHYLVPIGLASVFFGVVGFILMASGINRENGSERSGTTTYSADAKLHVQDHPRIGENIDLGRLDDPTTKF
jgi:hypothetical protein